LVFEIAFWQFFYLLAAISMDNNEEDIKLIEKYLNGDESAFSFLVDKYIRAVYNFIFLLIKDRSSTDDLTQETFVRTWKNLKRFDRNKKFRTWIYTIAKNAAYDYLRKKKTIPFSYFGIDESDNTIEEIPDSYVFPEEQFTGIEMQENLEKNLKKLPENYRVVLVMHYKDDLTLSEISKIFEKPESTIKSRHVRALAMLRKMYA